MQYNDPMTSDNQATNLEYSNKGVETPFETFLRYTNEKENSSGLLASILDAHEGTDVLDIGTGDGRYLELALSKVKGSTDYHLTLLEPSIDLIKQLRARFKKQSVELINSAISDYPADKKFDFVLASHLFYHIPRNTWATQLDKMLSLLNTNGKLIIVLRGEDDAYAFKMAFKPLLFAKDFKALTIADVLQELQKKQNLQTSQLVSESELNIPVDTNAEDTVSIIEFYLNKSWSDIPKEIQQDALEFIRSKHGTFKQLDNIAIIKKQ